VGSKGAVPPENVELEMATSKSGPRLHFLDGLRGLAAFYVLLFHASKPNIPYGGELSRWMKFVCLCLSCGHFSVVFFIVLSGFSIMLPIARSGVWRLNGGLADYARRRARRIFPPYYAALILSIGLIVTYNVISRHGNVGSKPVVEDALSVGSVVSHVLLVHNWSFDWAYRINGPLWSVATEWQIYFAFAFVLLPLWPRVGGAAMLLLTWVVTSLPFFLLPPNHNYWWACPWFTGSFVFGMWGASIGFAEGYRDSWLRNKAPWATLSLLTFAVIVALVATGRADSWSFPSVDVIVSAFAFCLINACVTRTARPSQGSPSLLLRVLGSKTLVALGAFSYSLYLIQHPVLRLAEKVVAKLTSSHDTNIQFHLLVVVPITVAVGWLFAEFFERPFTSGGLILPAIRKRIGLAQSESLKS